MVRYFRPGLGLVRAREVLPEGYRAPKDAAGYPDDATAMVLAGGRKSALRSWNELSNRRQVETLFVNQPHDEHIACVAKMPWLKRLGILQPKVADLSLLRELRTLECLFIEAATRLESIAFITELPELRALGIFDAKRLENLGGLESATQLEELALQCGIWNRFKVATLQPIATLKALTSLRLTAEAKDGSLEPLKNLTALEELDLNLLQPFEQVAKLAGFLPRQLCKYLSEPYEVFDRSPCGFESHQGIHVLKGRRDFCRDCHPGKLEQYLDEFERISAEARRRGTW